MPAPDPAALLDRHHYAAAVEAWRQSFPDPHAPAATWALAGIEERWGDSLLFSCQPGAAPHYHAALRALVPPGTQFSSQNENDRRMEAYSRVSNKLYAIDGTGQPRPRHDAQPHPDFRLPIARPDLQTRREAVQQARANRRREDTPLGRLFHDAGHHMHYELGRLWSDAGRALAAINAGAARRAYEWSLEYFQLYHRAWTAHLPASRWDSDGGAEMEEVHHCMDTLGPTTGPVPQWVEELLEGEIPQPAETPAAEPLATLLRTIQARQS